MNDPLPARLRSLPSVDRLATAVARAELAARRRELLDGGEGNRRGDQDQDQVDLVERARQRLTPSARVLNATGIVLHTNLGRAPLAAEARQAIAAAAEGYSALELDLATGTRARRGRRVESLLMALTGAQDALVVNNGAAAVLLAAAALAGPGQDVIVSRGELLEIGGGLRIADVVAQSGARLVEVGSTNRTRAEDYRAAIGRSGGAILRVHQSNFQMTGFVERPTVRELVEIGLPVIDDLGSGALGTEAGFGSDGALGTGGPLRGEPTAEGSIAAGVALACFSGDKLLGGPQAGILVGPTQHIDACRKHPLARALRIDKLCLAGLEATLELRAQTGPGGRRIPVLAMLGLSPAELQQRTARLAELTDGAIIDMPAPVGGGSLPNQQLPGSVVELAPGPEGADGLAARLRRGDPPLIARVHRDRVLLSARTLTCEEIELAGECVAAARRC